QDVFALFCGVLRVPAYAKTCRQRGSSSSVSTGMPKPAHPLVIRFGRLGDTVLLQPLLHKLQQRYGQPCDLLAIGAWPAELYASQPEVAEVLALRAPRRPLLLSREREHWVDHLLRFGDGTPTAFQGRCDALAVDPGAAPQLQVDALARIDCER